MNSKKSNTKIDITNTDTHTPNGISHNNNNEAKKGNSQRMVALIGVILLATVIVALLLTAIFDPTGVWFRACLVLAIALPILLWIYVWLYGMMKQKKTMASFEFLGENEKEE